MRHQLISFLETNTAKHSHKKTKGKKKSCAGQAERSHSKIYVRIFSTFLPVSSFSKSYKGSCSCSKLPLLDRTAVRIAEWFEKSFLSQCNQIWDSCPSHSQPINYRTINQPNQNRMCGAVAVFLEHLLWDADARHPRGFAVTSKPRWCTCSEQSRTNYKAETHNTICCLASWWH